MTLTHPELVAALDALQAKLPEMVKAYPDAGDFWDAFAGETEVIEAGDDTAFLNARIDAMLLAQGIAPAPFTRTETDLNAMVDLLEADVPRIRAKHENEGGFWCEFDSRADRLEESADPSDRPALRQRLDSMLLANGLKPENDVPC